MTKTNERLYVSTASLKDNRDLSKVLAVYQDLGIPRVEISALHDWMAFEDLVRLVRDFQAKGMRFIFHNYFPRPAEDFVLNLTSDSAVIRRQTQALIASAVRLAKLTGVDLYCFHAGYLADPTPGPNGMFNFPKQEAWLDDQAARKIILLHYRAFFEKLDRGPVYVGLENLFPPKQGPNCSTFCRFEDIEGIMEIPWIKSSRMGLLIDLGHLKISAKVLGFDREVFLTKIIEKYGPRIYEVHLSENDGQEDQHRIIKKNSWQLKCLKRFASTGLGLARHPTRFCIESRGLGPEELRKNYQWINHVMEASL